MWEFIHLPQETDGPGKREKWIEQFVAEKMQEYDGTVFLCISRSDQERRLTFRQASQSLGHSARDGRTICTAYSAEELAKQRNILFVEHSMQQYLGKYLEACPDGTRHLLFYSRRRGNGPSLFMSQFMDFWQEHGVDILDLRDVDEQPAGEVEKC